MMNFRILFILGIVLLTTCSRDTPVDSASRGQAAAESFCTGCHSFVSPEVFSKSMWARGVLPLMGLRMGVMLDGEKRPTDLYEEGPGGEAVRAANIYPEEALISKKQWEEIIIYFISNAPAETPADSKDRPGITRSLKNFSYKPVRLEDHPPMVTMVKILPDSARLAFSLSMQHQSALYQLNSGLDINSRQLFNEALVDYDQHQDQLILTAIGPHLYPTDTRRGRVYSMVMKDAVMHKTVLLDSLQRPTHTVRQDLNGDGRPDLLVSEFGNLLGKLAWYENVHDTTYRQHVLRDLPGAAQSCVTDIDGDGRPDILSLMSQGEEGIFVYRNQTSGFAAAEKILSFPPYYGSSHFDMADMNGDGLPDIIYTAGDNGDLTPVLKDFHGIYIFINQGNYSFREEYFYPLHGAYKALAEDFDLDGDLDISAISYFPDFENSPEEGFVYLENQGKMSFLGRTFPQVSHGRWLVMDTGDLDQDGDIDIALGSNVGYLPDEKNQHFFNQWLEDGPAVVVLENRAR